MIVGYVAVDQKEHFTVVTLTKNGMETLAPVSNDGESDIMSARPYVAHITLQGSSAILFHAWSNEAVASKAAAAKNSTAKKTDNVESYVYRDDAGMICLPGEYLRGALIGAARFRQDPRSPRKSAMDLYKAGVASLTELASLGSKDWDYLDRRRVTIQRNGITRERPAFRAGWKATFDLQVLLPEYISSTDLYAVLTDAGRVVGVGDFRPTYGRFIITEYTIDT